MVYNYNKKKYDPSKIDTCIHIGDSNTCGIALTSSTIPYPYTIVPNVLMWTKNSQTSVNDGSFQTLQQDVNQFSARVVSAGIYGSTMALGDEYIKLTGRKLAMIKMGVSGSLLTGSASASGGTGGSWSTTGGNYPLFKNYFLMPAISAITTNLGYTPNYKAIFIRLGTNDANNGAFANSSDFLCQAYTLIINIRNIVGNIPVYWYKIRPDLATLSASTSFSIANINTINNRLNEISLTSGLAYLPKVTIIDTGNNSSDMRSDGVHFTAEAYINQGKNEALIISNL